MSSGPHDVSDIQWIREALARIEGRLDHEKTKRAEECMVQSARLASLERWRSMLVGAWVVLAAEVTVGLTVAGILLGG